MSSDLRREAAAARQLVRQVREAGLDEEAVELTVASECDLNEALSGALATLDTLAALAEGCKRREAEIAARRQRFVQGAERLRGSILAALELSGVPLPVRLAEATVGVGKGRPRVLVTDPESVPPNLRRSTTTIVPDLALIGERLERGEDVPGATLSNAMPTLTVRRA